ncbi:MAG TPA: hypothetical protein VIK28_11045 [Sedimentisphaerales bacterium]
MKSGYSNQVTRQIGEHLVVAELGRRGILATPFAGNVPDYDILASGLMDQPFAVPWWDGLSLRLTARDALKPRQT